MSDRIYCAFWYECNNNCLICAVDAESRRSHSLSSTDIFRFLGTLSDIKDKNTEIEFSGGEPTFRPDFFCFLERLCADYPHLKYMLLTNGRSFSNRSIAARIADLNPLSILIPIHGDTPALHDCITQRPGSFNESMLGIHNLYEYGLLVGPKTVINGLNYKRLPQIIDLVAQRFPECTTLSLNWIDMQGKALINKDLVGVRLDDAARYIENALDAASSYGLRARTYSVPPCALGESHRKFVGEKLAENVVAKTPINNMKPIEQTYGTIEQCKTCRYYGSCDGTWHSYLDEYGKDEIKPIA